MKNNLVAVLDRDFSYSFYGNCVWKSGTRFPIGGTMGNVLTSGGLVFMLGQGREELIPEGFFHVEEEVASFPSVVEQVSTYFAEEW